MQWLFVHFPFLQLDHFLIDCGTANTTPTVVFATNQNEILQTCDASSAAGICPGMGLAQASALLSSIQLLPYSSDTESQHLKLLANSLYQIAADIVLLPPQSIAIRLDPLIHYYDSIDNFVALFHHQLQHTSLRYQFANGPTIESAQALALANKNCIFSDNATAMASLRSCPLFCTQFTAKHISQFHRMGLRNLAAVFQLPLEEIGKRFDNSLIRYLLALKGEKYIPRELYHPKPNFHYQIELPFEVDNSSKLLPLLTRPLSRCCSFLKQQHLTTDTLLLMLHLSDESTLNIEIHAGTSLYDENSWYKLLEIKLEQIQLTSPIRGVELRCQHTTAFHNETKALFSHRLGQHAENSLLGMLSAKLGRNAVYRPLLTEDHRPDCQLKNFNVAAEANQTTDLPASEQPSWLISTPQPLLEKVNIIYGPERINTGWWDGSPIKRDYFIAVNKNGQRLWVFRNIDGHWFLHGYFS